jgi:hypothetical protein
MRGAYPKIQDLQKRLALPVDLNSEFASGSHDDCDWTFHLLERTLVFDVPEHRQKESDGFSRSSLRNTNDISTRHDGGNSLRLNRCRGGEIEPLNHVQTRQS